VADAELAPDLWMKALASKIRPDSGSLVTSDFQGVPKEMSDRVFAGPAREATS